MVSGDWMTTSSCPSCGGLLSSSITPTSALRESRFLVQQKLLYLLRQGRNHAQGGYNARGGWQDVFRGCSKSCA